MRFRTTDQPRQGLKPGRKRRWRGFPEAPSGDSQDGMVGGGALAVIFNGAKIRKKGLNTKGFSQLPFVKEQMIC